MKRLSLIITLTGLFALGAYQVRAMPPQDNSQNTDQQDSTGTKAKNDTEEAGRDTRRTPEKRPAAP